VSGRFTRVRYPVDNFNDPGLIDPDLIDPDLIDPDLIDPDLIDPDLIDQAVRCSRLPV
jgi:hypothetical protein